MCCEDDSASRCKMKVNEIYEDAMELVEMVKGSYAPFRECRDFYAKNCTDARRLREICNAMKKKFSGKKFEKCDSRIVPGLKSVNLNGEGSEFLFVQGMLNMASMVFTMDMVVREAYALAGKMRNGALDLIDGLCTTVKAKGDKAVALRRTFKGSPKAIVDSEGLKFDKWSGFVLPRRFIEYKNEYNHYLWGWIFDFDNRRIPKALDASVLREFFTVVRDAIEFDEKFNERLYGSIYSGCRISGKRKILHESIRGDVRYRPDDLNPVSVGKSEGLDVVNECAVLLYEPAVMDAVFKQTEMRFLESKRMCEDFIDRNAPRVAELMISSI